MIPLKVSSDQIHRERKQNGCNRGGGRVECGISV
jgi:hypothetical protein